jgi:glycosyltransferase involved in cell wall biosynthesis
LSRPGAPNGPHSNGTPPARDPARAPLELIYVRPSSGGIRDYSDVLLRILRAEYPTARISVATADNEVPPGAESTRLVEEIRAQPGIVFADLGSGDVATFRALRRVVRSRSVLVTIHDPGIVVSPFRIPALARGRWPLPILEWHVGRLAKAAFGNRLIRDLLAKTSARLVLNPSIPEVAGQPLTYLPQPTYEPEPIPYRPPERPKVAFCGYWSPSKGLNELLEAYAILLPRFPDARLVIAGGPPSPGDAFGGELRASAAAVSSRIEMPGFVPPEQFGAFFAGLSALVLPYHPEVPGGASAMLMRAQERGVPLIVSDTPRLRTQVDPASVTLVPPRDGRGLADAITDHLENPTRYAARARREQERIYREHGHASVAARLRRILDGSPRR